MCREGAENQDAFRSVQQPAAEEYDKPLSSVVLTAKCVKLRRIAVLWTMQRTRCQGGGERAQKSRE